MFAVGRSHGLACRTPGDCSRVTASTTPGRRRAPSRTGFATRWVMTGYAERGETFHQIVDRYVAALLFQTSQSAACNRLHDLQQRTARWLLTMVDRYRSDEMPLTHDFLAMMLGTSRPKVSASLGALARQGIIRNERGSVCVLDRAGIEVATCECYGLIRAEFERLLGSPVG